MPNLGQVKILLVDDLKDNLLALEGLLRRDDVEIFKAASGTEALEFLMNHEFALALIDVQMPRMSGFELAELMRGARKTKGIPIIFVTATARDQTFSFKGYESGAVDFLLKPLDTYAVRSKVSVFIELYMQKRRLNKQLETITGLIEAVNFAKTEAETANASKSQFLAIMSHEIRTPVAAVLGFTELMKNPSNTDAENQSFLAIVDRNAKRLLRLVDDVLDLSKVEAGMMTTEIIPFSVGGLLADLVADMRYRARYSMRRLLAKLMPSGLQDAIVSKRTALGKTPSQKIRAWSATIQNSGQPGWQGRPLKHRRRLSNRDRDTSRPRR